jgi:glycosyltransferase involved in cell wall biosynthesis
VPLPTDSICLMIARLLADKGVAEYLAAARQVKALRPHASFRLLGPADPNPAAFSPGLLNQAILEGSVEYLGETSDVRPAIAASSIFVLPSYREGLPRSTLEAMAMGRPVITTDTPGCRETVEAGVNGLLVPVKSISQLVEAMLRLIDNPGLRQRMGDAGRTLALSRFASRDVAKNVIDLLGLEGSGQKPGPTGRAYEPAEHNLSRENDLLGQGCCIGSRNYLRSSVSSRRAVNFWPSHPDD